MIDSRLTELKILLPVPAAPVASYAPFVRSGSIVYVSGQLPKKDDQFVTGICGKDLSIAEAQDAAKLCALHIIAQVKSACGGNLDRVKRIIKLGVFVACEQDFVNQPAVANGASELFQKVFGDSIGIHARSAVGVSSLPLGVCVEIDAVVEIHSE